MTIKIRFATLADASAVAGIYGPFCEGPPITFEKERPTSGEIENRIGRIVERYPWLGIYNRVGFKADACMMFRGGALTLQPPDRPPAEPLLIREAFDREDFRAALQAAEPCVPS